MPWLGCSLEGVPSTTLQGEAVRATLKICNRGRYVEMSGLFSCNASLAMVSWHGRAPVVVPYLVSYHTVYRLIPCIIISYFFLSHASHCTVRFIPWSL